MMYQCCLLCQAYFLITVLYYSLEDFVTIHIRDVYLIRSRDDHFAYVSFDFPLLF